MACNDCLGREEIINLINATTGSSSSSSGSTPTGAIMFVVNAEASNFDTSGLGSGKWAGWAIANGNNGTVDWTGKYVVTRDPGDVDFNTADTTGGSKTFTLTSAQLPAHTHTETLAGHTHTITDPGHTHTATTSNELSSVTALEAPSQVVNVNDGLISVTLSWQEFIYENAPAALNDPVTVQHLVRTTTGLVSSNNGTVTTIGTHAPSTVTIPAHNHGSINLAHDHTVTVNSATTGVTTGSANVGGGNSGSTGSGDAISHNPPFIVGIPIQKIS